MRQLYQLFDAERSPAPELIRAGVHPPVPITEDAVVWGAAMIGEAQRLGIETLPVQQLSADRGEALLLALRLEERCDSYGWEEQRRILEALEDLKPSLPPDRRTRLARDVAALVSSHGGFAHRVGRYRALPEPVRRLVAGGLMELKAAERAAALPEEVLALIGEETRALSVSRRRQFAELLYELTQGGRSGTDGLADVARAALESGEPIRYLRGLRYPELSELERAHAEIVDRALSGSGVRCEPPAYFEGEAFSVSFSFASGVELERRIQALERLRDETEQLFALL
jgi:hypothetical protein